MNIDGFLGKGLANSFHGGDKSTGSLMLPAFTVERRFITFLIGGGGWPNELADALRDPFLAPARPHRL